LPFSFI